MKIKNIAGICKKRKTVVIYDRTDPETGELQQYIGDGGAIYPVYELPYVEKESLMAIFDVPEKQRDDIHFEKTELPEAYDMADAVPDGEEMVTAEDVMLISGGRTLKPLHTSDGMVFIDIKYIRPMADVLDVLEFYERKTPKGQIYIVAKAGYLLQAVIEPLQTVSEDFTRTMENLAAMCREARDLDEARQASEEDGVQQVAIPG